VPIFYTRTLPTRSADPNADSTISIACLAGDLAVSGGYTVSPSLILYQSIPIATANSPILNAWQISVKNPTGVQFGMSVSVVCLDQTP
jgi:hypothetical protein